MHRCGHANSSTFHLRPLYLVHKADEMENAFYNSQANTSLESDAQMQERSRNVSLENHVYFNVVMVLFG